MMIDPETVQPKLTFDIYGRFFVEVVRGPGGWEAFRVDQGRRLRAKDLAIPSDLAEAEIGRYLDDIYHEWAAPGKIIRRME